jgi:SAM-dependent methyltransferase
MPVDPDEFRAESLANWRASASGWEHRRAWLLENMGGLSDRLLELADLRPGRSVLELAAGTGDLGRMIAALVGPTGSVLSTDFSPEMVDAARRLAGESDHVEYRVLDAERMDLPDRSFDAAVCRLGYMLMADPAAALSETRRVLREGGTVTFAVWAGPERNPWVAAPGAALVRRGHAPPPEPGAPGMFALADPDRVRALVVGAGFAEPELVEVPFDVRYADVDDLWDSLVRLSAARARVLVALDEGERQATRTALEQSVAPWVQADGAYVVPALALVAHAR